MKLMIIESPGKIPKLKAILGDGWQIAASIGYVRDLPKKEMGEAIKKTMMRHHLGCIKKVGGSSIEKYVLEEARHDHL